MIDFAQLLSVTNIECKVDVKSKKKALQKLSELLFVSLTRSNVGEALPNPEDAEEQSSDDVEEVHCEMDILDAFIGRERLGSTGLGNGIAIPHGRLEGLDAPIACLVTLDEGVEFEAPDDQPVDTLFGLLVPSESTEDHLQILAHMANAFSDKQLCADIRSFESEQAEALHARLQEWSREHIDQNNDTEDPN